MFKWEISDYSNIHGVLSAILVANEMQSKIKDNLLGFIGFRVASIPEPATLLLFGLGAMMLKRKQ